MKIKKWVIKPPKTRAGARFCPLTKDVIDAAKTFDFSQLNPDKIEGYWQRQKEKQGFKFKFHAFRHYWASCFTQTVCPISISQR